jgi:hypothetical protein
MHREVSSVESPDSSDMRSGHSKFGMWAFRWKGFGIIVKPRSGGVRA